MLMEDSLNLKVKEGPCKCLRCISKFEKCCGLGLGTLQMVEEYSKRFIFKPKPKQDRVKRLMKKDKQAQCKAAVHT